MYLQNFSLSLSLALSLQGSEEPIEALMFDLQTMRVSSPMIDFTTYLSLSAYTDVRHKHFDEIFEQYYNQLVGSFKRIAQETEIPDYLRFVESKLHTLNHFLLAFYVHTNYLSSFF